MLFGLFVWWIIALFANRRVTTHFVAINSGSVSRGTVPLIPHLDFEEIIKEKKLEEISKYFNYQDLSDLWEGDASQVKKELLSLDYDKNDSLILYIGAHGLSDFDHAKNDEAESTAVLLQRDFSLSNSSAVLPVREILDTVKECKAPKKLVVFDSGYLNYDRRLGVMINDFAKLVADQVKEVADPNLWVICGSSVGESSTLAFNQKQTLLAQKLFDGLLGEADGKTGQEPDRYIDLYELFGFAAKECVRHSGEKQTPVLLNWQGPVEHTDLLENKVVLAKLSGKPPKEEPSEEEQQKEEEAKKADEKENVDAPKKTEEKKQTEAVAENEGDSEETTPAAKEPEPDPIPVYLTESQKSIRQQIEQAWELRDSCQSFQDSVWLPLDFAPQLWRRLNIILVDLEREYRCDALRNTQTKLQIEIEQLTHLLGVTDSFRNNERFRDKPSNEPSVAQLIIRKLEQAAKNAPNRNTVVPLRGGIKTLNRAILQIPDFIAIYAQVDGISNGLIDDLLAATSNLEKELSRLNGVEITSDDEAQLQALSGEVTKAIDEVNTTIARLIRDNLFAYEKKSDLAARQQLGLMLDSPLLVTEQRMKILDVLMDPSHENKEEAQVFTKLPEPVLEVMDIEWETLSRLAQLESSLSKLLDASREKSRRINSWSTLFDFEKSLCNFYLRTSENASDDNRLAAFFVDGRDRPIAIEDPIANWNIKLTNRLNVQFFANSAVLENDRALLLIKNQEVPVDLEIDYFQSARKNIRVAAQVMGANNGAVTIRWVDQPQNRATTQLAPKEFTLVSEGKQTQRFYVRTSQDNRQGTAVQLRFVVQDADVSSERFQRLVKCELPNADQIELAIDYVNSSNRTETQRFQSPDPEHDSLKLFIYPSPDEPVRANKFRFQLTNRSGVDKNLKVELFPLPREAYRRSTWAPGRFLNIKEEPEFDFEMMAERIEESGVAIAEATVSLKPDSKLEDVQFKKPGSGKKPDPPAEGAAPPPAEKPAPAKAIDVTEGFVCRMTDDKGKKWYRWIALELKRPADYIRTRVSYRAQRLVVDISPTADAPQPVIANIEIARQGSSPEIRKKQLDVTDESFSFPFSRRNTRNVDLTLDIDGFPRALSMRYTIPNNRLIDINPKEIAFSSMSFRELQEPITLRPGDNERIVQKAKKLEDEVEVAYQILTDINYRDLDRIEVRDAIGERSVATLRAERAIRSEFALLNNGTIALTSRASDHAFSRPSFVNSVSKFELELYVKGVPRPVSKGSVSLLFDSLEPENSRINFVDNRVTQGKPLEFNYRVSDNSGIGLVEFAASPVRTRKPDEYPVVTEITGNTGRIDDGIGRVNTGEMKLPEGLTESPYFLFGRYTDLAGNQYEADPVRFTLVAKPPKDGGQTGKDDGPLIGTIRGRVAGPSRIEMEVTITGGPDNIELKSPETKKDGRFEFKNMKAGTYKFSASGSPNGRYYETPADKIKEQSFNSKADFEKPVVVPVEK